RSRAGLWPAATGADDRRPSRLGQITNSKRNSSDLFACRWLRAPATIDDEGLADVEAASSFRLPRLHPGIRSTSASLQHAALLADVRMSLASAPEAFQRPGNSSKVSCSSVSSTPSR